MGTIEDREKIATLIAIIFHTIGLVGFFFINKEQFAAMSWINLLLMLLLLFLTQRKITAGFIVFFILCFVTGMLVEISGTATGNFFGEYAYGDALGYKYKNVPLIIGVNWFIIIYCCATSIQMLSDKLTQKTGIEGKKGLKMISVIADTALLAVLFDWIMEPAAIKLGFWYWKSLEIPFYNYVSWFVVSALLAAVYQFCRFPRPNKFAVNLLLIQAMFFLIIRSFL